MRSHGNCVRLNAEEILEWGRLERERIAGGSDDVPARAFRAAQAIVDRTGRRVLILADHVCVGAVGPRGRAAGECIGERAEELAKMSRAT